MRAPAARILHDYVIESQVGEGTSGQVFRALHVPTSRTVAIKVLHLIPDVDPARQIAEAQLLRALAHPGIISIQGHGFLDDGRAYLVMPWLRGEDLAQRQRRAPLSPVQALQVGARVAEALAVAHAAAIIHRDIKPANIFLVGSGPDEVAFGQPTLLDFGVAMRLEVACSDQTIAGTPAYMAPEQARGDLVVGPAADIYALGATIYELLAGRPPHEGPTLLATLARLVTTPAPRLTQVAPSTPPEVADFVHRMLSLAPEDRPVNAGLIAETLDKLAGRIGRGSLADVEPFSTRLGSSAQRLITSLVASGFAEAALRDQALANLREHDADAVPLGRHALIAHFGMRRARGSEATSALHLARRAARLGAQVGVASGRAMVPHLATAESLQFLGDVVERATLLARSAEPASVICDETTVELGHHRYRFRKTQDGHFVVETRTGSGRMPSASPFVGRDAEFQSIVEAYQRCEDLSEATIVSISGDPGIGKSRLQREVVLHLLGQGGLHAIIQQRNDPYGQRRALGAAGDIIRSLLRLPKGATPELVTQAISAHVDFSETEHLTTRADVLTQLLCNLPTEADRDESQAIRDVLWLLMTRLVLKSLEQGPVVITSEDIQWADPESLNWFEHLLARAKAHTLLLIVTSRYEFWRMHPDAFSRHNHLKLQLNPVSDECVRKMVRSTLFDATGGGAVNDADVDRVVERAGGSPLFAEELSRLAARGTNVAVAPTIEAAIQVSLDSLDEEQADALGRLSVLGATVWDDALAHLGFDNPEIVLRALTEREILVSHDNSRFSAHRERHFKHAMVRDVAYARLGPIERRELHALAADWLQRVGEDAAIVAGHLDLAELPERAATYWALAARRALNANALQEALRMAERAVIFSGEPEETFARAQLLDEIWARQDARAADRESAIAAMEDNVTNDVASTYAQGARARYDAARGQGLYIGERLERVRKQAQRLGLSDEEARCSAELATRFAFAGEHDKAEQEVRRLLELAQNNTGLMASAVNAWQVLAIVRQTQGALLEALQARRNAAAAAHDAELRERESVLTSNLGFALTTLGAKREALEMLEQGLELATAIGSHGAVRHARMLMLCWASVFGDAPQLVGQLDEQRLLADEAAAGMWTAPARENLGILYYRGVELLRQAPGHWSWRESASQLPSRRTDHEATPDRARILLRMSARAYRNTNNHDVLPVALGMWALAEHLTQHTDRGHQIATEAANLLASGAPSLLNETPIFLTLHDVYSSKNDSASAQAAIEQALPFLMRRVRSLTASLYQHQFLTQLDDNARLITLATQYGLTGPYPELTAEHIRPPESI